MTTIIQQSSGTETRQIPIGAKLQSARESLRLDRKDAAAQLRLNENVIDMIESNSFPDDMPPLFIRGYIRSYGKLLQISDADILAAIEPMKPKAAAPAAQPTAAAAAAPKPAAAVKTDLFKDHKHLVQGLTAGIFFLLLGMVGAWWHGRPSTSAASHVTVAELNDTIAPAGVSVQLAKATDPMPAPIQIGAANEPDLEDR